MAERRRFRTFSNGFLLGQNKMGYNYTQTIQCTPNNQSLYANRAPVQHFKTLYTSPIYNEEEERLEWSTEPIIERRESSLCPHGFKRVGKFCHECDNCEELDLCEKGYRKNVVSGLCEDIDECLENANICQYMCENQLGSYQCYCPMGYKMNSFGTCQDINECRQFKIDCGQDRTCFNTKGAYECVDIPCPTGYIRQNESDCILKCYYHSTTCRLRQAIYVRYLFAAVSRLTFSNRTLLSLPIVYRPDNSLVIIDKNNVNTSLPFIIDGIDLKTDRTLFESNEYEFEIHLYNSELNDRHLAHRHHHYRRRLHTIFVIRINVSPFHF